MAGGRVSKSEQETVQTINLAPPAARSRSGVPLRLVLAAQPKAIRALCQGLVIHQISTTLPDGAAAASGHVLGLRAGSRHDIKGMTSG